MHQVSVLAFIIVMISSILAGERTYTMQISEGGQIFQQRVMEVDDDLTVMDVPAHGGRQHAVFYFDYKNGLQLVKNVDLKKCQVSKMNDEETAGRQRHFTIPQEKGLKLINAADLPMITLVDLEDALPLESIDYLRPELRAACAGLPVYRVEKVAEENFKLQVGLSAPTAACQYNQHILLPSS